MIPQKVADTAYATTGVAASTFPWWADAISWLAGANQAAIQIGGLFIVLATLAKVITEWRIARRRLRDLERGE